MKFATRYKSNPKKLSVMDEHDCVDRLSYVDSTKMVQRMITEGHNLMAYRALALKGSYLVDELIEDEKLPALGVYEEDPVIAGAKYEVYKQEMNNRKSAAFKEEVASDVPVDNKVETSIDTE